ncbi:MAG: hypothetical protein KF718_00755 [Polyangiaceae bacterium]|nr:hypothetical protein [Polyangiaceae bacterium]
MARLAHTSLFSLVGLTLALACGSSDDSGLTGGSGGGGGSGGAAAGSGTGGTSAGAGGQDASAGGVAGSTGGSAGSTGGSAGSAAASGSGGAAGAGGAETGGAGGIGTGGANTGGSAGAPSGGSGGMAGATGGTGGGNTGGTGGIVGTGGTGGTVSAVGCSDGQREGYTNLTSFPNIAACAGGFSVAGVKTTASMTPQCGRNAGDDSSNASGTGCSVADLCAEGWRVCNGSADVTARAAGCTTATGFWATRQSTSNGTSCSATGTNNVVGCGTTGYGFSGGLNGCSPLNRAIGNGLGDCPAGWSCGSSSSSEANNVTRFGTGSTGGVLCCRENL